MEERFVSSSAYCSPSHKVERHGKIIQFVTERWQNALRGKDHYRANISVIIHYRCFRAHTVSSKPDFFLQRGEGKNPQPEVALSSQSSSRPQTHTDCAASKPSIYLELSLSLLAHERSRRAQTCLVPRKSRLFHRSFVTCSHSSTRWSITWHRQLPVSRRDTPMNTSPSSIPCSYLTYAHSSDVTNGPLVGWVSKTGQAVIKRTQWHTCR